MREAHVRAIYLLNRDNLGVRGQGANGGDAVLSRIGPYGAVYASMGVWCWWISLPSDTLPCN